MVRTRMSILAVSDMMFLLRGLNKLDKREL